MNIGTFLSGVTAATFFASAIFFLKFWKVSRDRFFFIFATACTLLCLERVTLAIFFADHIDETMRPSEAQFWVYLIRAAAFALMVYAIIERNTKAKAR